MFLQGCEVGNLRWRVKDDVSPLEKVRTFVGIGLSRLNNAQVLKFEQIYSTFGYVIAAQ